MHTHACVYILTPSPEQEPEGFALNCHINCSVPGPLSKAAFAKHVVFFRKEKRFIKYKPIPKLTLTSHSKVTWQYLLMIMFLLSLQLLPKTKLEE